MSSDLLKEFGNSDKIPWRSEGAEQHNAAVDDDFGDFEEPEIQANPTTQPHQLREKPSVSQIQYDHNAEHEEVEEDFADDPWGETQEPNLDWDWQAPSSPHFERAGRPKQRVSSVLFDAEEESPVSTKPVPSAPKAAHEVSKPAVVETQDDDFAAWEPTDALEDIHHIKALAPEEARPDAPQKASVVPSRVLDSGPPPTNVPPPSLLLSLSNDILRETARSSSQSVKAHSVEPEAGNTDNHLSDLKAIGRILAGRKSRWNRDSFLSQSMRIGQAGTQGGMKLTKVDKTESRREEQEAAELLKTWKQHAGALRFGLAQGKTHQIPELTASMPVRIAKPGEGALTAPKPCFLCGLKRDERVLRVDFEVEDGFGLWWVEYWGHCDCVHFWNRHQKQLPQR